MNSQEKSTFILETTFEGSTRIILITFYRDAIEFAVVVVICYFLCGFFIKCNKL